MAALDRTPRPQRLKGLDARIRRELPHIGPRELRDLARSVSASLRPSSPRLFTSLDRMLVGRHTPTATSIWLSL